MPTLRTIVGGLRSIFRKQRVDAELDEELRGFLEMAAEEKMKHGASRKEALRAVRLELGNLEAAKEVVRDARWEFVEMCWRNLRFALRTLRKSPGFAATAIVTLSHGIGANTAIFMLLDAIRLRSLPVQDPQELAEVRITDSGHQGMGLNPQYGELTRPLWQRIRDHQQSFSAVFAWSVNLRYVGRGSEMRHFRELRVSGDFFRVLG